MEEPLIRLESSLGLLRSELSELKTKLGALLWFQIGSWVILIAVIIITWFFPHFTSRVGMPRIPSQVP